MRRRKRRGREEGEEMEKREGEREMRGRGGERKRWTNYVFRLALGLSSYLQNAIPHQECILE